MPKTPKTTYLKDYNQPDYWITKTDLNFELAQEQTRVTSRLSFELNRNKWPEIQSNFPALVLDGSEAMILDSLSIDGVTLDAHQYQLSSDSLSFSINKAAFETQIVSLIKPQHNSSMEGLYQSGGAFCTQCEPQGFRKITWYLDRPDVMSFFTTRIEADRQHYPVLLSNGNCIDKGESDGGRHWVCWEDPFRKPAYLFALVAGELEKMSDNFTTCSGRNIKLEIFCEAHNITKCDHAMSSLKKAMKWDEEVYGREYDLDIFMIVAVDFFNMGAMENKGLNIFNSSCVLAKPETATDATYQRIEGVVAHEYFHNWSGNRVTCRDWFQLSLKEGLTVFRDSEFSADMNSRAVKRIEEVNRLRSAQFAEDAGPMSHPVRPCSYMEISNFYTLTIYNKGAEVVRMIYNLVGKKGFRLGTDLYFKRHDGQAVTCEDFISAMEDANQIELTQFMRWYHQGGTPELTVKSEYDEKSHRYSLEISQQTPMTPDQTKKEPFQIPIAIGLIDENGNNLEFRELAAPDSTLLEKTVVLELRKEIQTFQFENIASRPVVSLLRGFSAPVKLNYNYSREELLFLIRYDEDGFNRWNSTQLLVSELLIEWVGDIQAGKALKIYRPLLDAWLELLNDEHLDQAMLAEMLTPPDESWLAQQFEVVDVDAISEALEFYQVELAKALKSEFVVIYDKLNQDIAYKPIATDIASRKLKNVILKIITKMDNQELLDMATSQYYQSTNMTDCIAALVSVYNSGAKRAGKVAEELLAHFYEKWQEDANVMDMWFSLQVGSSKRGCLEGVNHLMKDPLFDMKNPNKVRAVIVSFCYLNQKKFHDSSGSGYRFLADQVIKLNGINPQVASRLLIPLTRWRRYDEKRQKMMILELKRIKSCQLSEDVYEIVVKGLK